MPVYSIPRHVWRAIYPILIFFALSFFVVIAIAVPYFLGFAFESAGSGAMPSGPAVAEQAEGFLAFIAPHEMLIQLFVSGAGVLVFALMWRKTRAGCLNYGDNKLSAKLVLLTVLLGAALNIALASLFVLTDITRFFPEYDAIAEMLSGGSFLTRLLAIGFGAPIVEELCCRGIVFNRLASWMPAWVAVLVSSALFGAMHLNMLQGLYAFALGVVFCVLYVRYRNLWVPIIGHIAFNAVNVLAYEAASAAEVDASLESDVSASLVLLLISAFIAAACVYAMIKHTKPAVFAPGVEASGGADEMQEDAE